jgi:hypothetical protein
VMWWKFWGEGRNKCTYSAKACCKAL